MSAEQKYSMETPPEFSGEPRVIAAYEWRHQRWGWLEGVRRDAQINFAARLMAHSLAMDFANVDTARCDPKHADLARALDTSTDTIKRGIRDLISAEWIVIIPGRGRGRSTAYGFLTRARIVPIKGGKSAPLKGGKSAPFYAPEKGADLHLKGGKSAPPYIKDKPYKNQRAREARVSDNPMVVKEAIRAVDQFRSGDGQAFEDLQPWIIDHIIAAEMLTEDELRTVGIC